MMNRTGHPETVTEAATRTSEPDDQELVALSRKGEIEAYDQLIKRYQGRIYALTYNMTSNSHDADDLTQEIFVKAYRSLGRFRGKSSFYTWLYRIAVNHSINFLKKRGRRTMLSLDDIDQAVERDPDYVDLSSRGGPFRSASISELHERLNRALQTLSEKHRAVVVLHDIQGIPHDQIARMMRCSSGTVRSRLFYARRQLQVELKEFAP